LPDSTVLPIRVYLPVGGAGRALPGVVNFHGGGWVGGDPQQSVWWCSGMPALAGIAVVSVAYRLAPGNPFPVLPRTATRRRAGWRTTPPRLGVDPTRPGVMGDSAGGNVAAVVCLMARDRGRPSIALHVLLYPSAELIDAFPSADEKPARAEQGGPDVVQRFVRRGWRRSVRVTAARQA
jgi:acetyl esterase